ncbi:MAG: DUF4388 domain-containing protein [Candidatus Aminicenantes bacterium]|nr:DUF4388 domain-containing protein [Candidatus Aminicenantes bacterium]
MAFKGTLRDFKVPDILQLISYQRKSGLLTFTNDNAFVTLVFEKGFIVGVDSFPKKIELRSGSVLVKQDLISEEMLDRALSIQKRTNQKIGEILLSMGLIGESTIAEALHTQATEIILSLFKWKKGEYNFKVLDVIEPSMKIIEPLSTDNIIMEGVQMLDEWPQIIELIPNENIVFEPSEIDSSRIEIVNEYDDPRSDSEKVFLTEGELGVLKYINGENTVLNLVEMGIFNKYKVYKSIYNLLKKYIIQKKESNAEKEIEQELKSQKKVVTVKKINTLQIVYIILLFIILLITFYTPMKPFDNTDIFGIDTVKTDKD